MEITSLSQLDLTKVYSYADYYSWKFQEKVELFKGKIMKMSPAPSREHQRILTYIGNELYNFLKGQPCQVFFAPFDVRLEKSSDDTKVENVVQPDISVICDLTKLDDRGCVGAPELIIEFFLQAIQKKK